MDVELKKEDFKKISYWIICKFIADDFHKQSSSSRSDLLGGFFDRWINRAPEFLIFNKLLEDKNYDVVIDNFLYGQDTAKNSPDVLGLTDGNKDYPFALFNNGEWNMVPNAPFIEMKTFRNTQSLITIPSSQFDEEHYYALVESNISSSYLISLFDDSFFDKENFNIMFTNKEFVREDKDDQLIVPQPLEKLNNLGFYRLLGIYKGSELKKYAIEVGVKNDKPQKPRYLSEIFPIESSKGKEHIVLAEGMYYHLDDDDKEHNIPIYVEYGENSKINVLRSGKTFMEIQVFGTVKINMGALEEGIYRMNFKNFDRSSKSSEYVMTKDLINAVAQDSTKELLNEFDMFVKNN